MSSYIWGGACAGLYPLFTLLAADGSGIVTGAMFLCQCVACGEMSVKKGLFGGFHVAYGAFALLAIALFWVSVAAYSGPFWHTAFALIPAAATWGAIVLMKKKPPAQKK